MRKILSTSTAPRGHWVGDGFPVRSLFSHMSGNNDNTPFLMLDYGGPHEFGPAARPRGVDVHPHKGFETVTIVYSGEVELTDLRDRKLAEVLLFYGEWSVEGPLAITEGGEFAGVEFVAMPEEPSDQGWDGIGWASRIFSRYYAAQTIDGDQVIQLHGEAAPEWFAPLSDWDFKNSGLAEPVD